MKNDNANIIKIDDIKESSFDEFLFFLSLAKILRCYIAKLPEQIVTGMAIPFFNITEEMCIRDRFYPSIIFLKREK